MKKRLVRLAILGGCTAFLGVGIQCSKYKAEGLFKVGVEKRSQEGFLEGFLGGAFKTERPEAISIMRSYQILRPLVESLGLQVVVKNGDWIGKKIANRFLEATLSQMESPLEDKEKFEFQNVRYQGEKRFRGFISMIDETHYALYALDKTSLLAQGAIGVPLQVETLPLQFTLSKAPSKRKLAALQVLPWKEVADDLKEKIDLESEPDQESFIRISILDRDRCLAARIVNGLMSQYQIYLKNDFEEAALQELSYLERKQSQVIEKMDSLFDEHIAHLSQNLKTGGYFALEEGTKLFMVPHQEMKQRISSIDLELLMIDQFEREGKVVASLDESKSAESIRELKRERDLLELSLRQTGEEALLSRREELKEVRNQRVAVEKLAKEVDLGREISSFDLSDGLTLWAKNIQDPEEREDFAQYLENYSRLLSMREKMLQERFFYGKDTPSELDGIDLDSARVLFLEYNRKLDTAESKICQYSRFKKEMENPQFDPISLGPILSDPLCQKIIADVSKLSLQLKDEKHSTLNEMNRWSEELNLQKKILSNQLEQLLKVEELNSAMTKEKMGKLQKITLDSLNQTISVLHEQSSDAMKERRKSLLLEREILEKTIENARSDFASRFPEKWRNEKWLEVKSEMLNAMMASVTTAAEGKSLAAHLHRIESKPLDLAEIPLIPVKPLLIQGFFAGALLFPFFLFAFSFARELFKGFPLTPEKLQALGLSSLGEISSFCDTGSDLDLLRKMALFTKERKVISLIAGHGPDYSFALVENLSRIPIKSILIRCDFLSKFQNEDLPGVLQVWKGEVSELPIRQGAGFDFLSSGGYTLFGTEVIQSQRFASMIDLLKGKYDQIFLLFRSSLSSAESMAALQISDKAIVTVSEETTEELTPFINWAYHKENGRLTFITRA
jgi:hypothetical protein